jgi:hypothetical protein
MPTHRNRALTWWASLPRVLLAGALFAMTGAAAGPVVKAEGRDATQHDSRRPKVTATFPREGYRPGQPARVVFYSTARDVTIQFMRCGLERVATKANDILRCAPVTGRSWVGTVRPGRVLHVRIGDWPSGV